MSVWRMDPQLAALRETIEADPTVAEPWLALGVLHASRGERASAVAAYRKLVALDPGREDAAAAVRALTGDAGLSHHGELTVVAVRPDNYAHSDALRELAESVHLGLVGLGLDSRLRGAPESDRTNVIVGAHLLEAAGLQPTEGSIIFNTEQVHSRSPWLGPTYLEALRTHRVWDYSAENVDRLREHGVAHAIYVPIGHVEELRRIATRDEDIDVVFAGSMSERRVRVLNDLRDRGLSVETLFGVYGMARDEWIARARVVLNLGYYDEGPFETIRVSYLLSNERFVVSEAPRDRDSAATFADGVVFAPYDRLVDTCVAYVNRLADRRRIATRGLEIMRARPMHDIVHRALLATPRELPRASPAVVAPLSGPLRTAGVPSMAALCCLYDDLRWLEPCISAAYAECDRIYFVVSERPWSGPARDLQPTFDAIARLPDPESKIVVLRGPWTVEADQRNAGLEAMAAAGFDYCFVLDCDEIYDPVELRRMKQIVFGAPTVECWHLTWFTYWKSERYRIEPPEPFKPLVFLRIGSARFAFIRDVTSTSRALLDPRAGTCHHMSYARSSEEVLLKVSSTSHAHEIVEDWYEKVWLAWDDDHAMTNLHPTHPTCYARAVEQPVEMLPPILRDRARVLGPA